MNMGDPCRGGSLCRVLASSSTNLWATNIRWVNNSDLGQGSTDLFCFETDSEYKYKYSSRSTLYDQNS